MVSASNKWIVQAGFKHFNININHVLGMNLKVIDGVLKGQPLEPVPNEAGKVKVINKYINKKPVIVFGNSLGDLAMLEYSKDLAVVVNPEGELANIALQKGWGIWNIN